MFVLEVRAHGNLALKSSIAYWAMIRQAFGVCCEMFCQVIFPEESFLANAALVGLDASMAHFVAAHVSAVRELHIAYVALEQFPVRPWVGILGARHIVIVR